MTNMPAPLTVRNLAGQPLRLHFRCDGRAAWEAWAPAGGDLAVPAAPGQPLSASACYVDPHTHVSYTAAQVPARPGTRLVAAVQAVARARSFGCAAQAGSGADVLELLNTTDGDVDFVLAFAGTPFVIQCPLRPGASLRLRPGRFDLSATLNGVSAPPMAIAGWPALVEVVAKQLHGIEAPHFRLPAANVDSGA
jgi:hypothetical protein